MSFGAPLALLGLALLPALAVLYARHQRSRVRAAQAFSAPHLAASVTPDRPGWRRHAPIAVLALAIALIIVASAKPQTTVAVPVEHASILLATDVSGSMKSTDVTPSRLVAARRAATTFVDRVPSRVNVGVMEFNQSPTVLQTPTTDRVAAKTALQRMQSGGTTAIGDAITAAVRILTSTVGKPPPAAIVLLTDGKSTRGSSPVAAAQQAGRRHVPVYTVALGTPGAKDPPDQLTLRQIAAASGGAAYQASDAQRLSQVYERLGSQLGRKNEPRQISSLFAAGALALLLAGASLTLRWFGRLI